MKMVYVPKPLQLYHLLLIVGILSKLADAACQSCLMDLAIPGIFKKSARGLGPSNDGNNDLFRHRHSSFQQRTLHSSVGIPFGQFMKNKNIGSPALSSIVGKNGAAGVSKITLWKALDNIKGIELSVLSFLVAQRVFLAGGLKRKQHGIRHNEIANGVKGAEPRLFDVTQQKLRTWRGMLLLSDGESDLNKYKNDGTAYETAVAKNEGKSEQKEGEIMSSSMIIAIGFYKKWISPLLPPACRFLPTCSQYGVQAIQEFGPSKGLILTAWRLARCSPLGGRGYDPPKWPPVPYTYGSY